MHSHDSWPLTPNHSQHAWRPCHEHSCPCEIRSSIARKTTHPELAVGCCIDVRGLSLALRIRIPRAQTEGDAAG
eukprot:10936061-Alexandrium_andersonii.AAC.1